MTTAITPQSLSDAGVNVTMQSAALSMSFVNDGRTFLSIVNGDAGTPTITITKQNKNPSAQGFNPITLTDTVDTIPATGTNGGRFMVGPFAQSEYSDATGLVQVAFSAVTSMTVAAIQLPRV